MTKIVSEDLLDVIACIGAVRDAADRLGVSPREAAARVQPGLQAFRESSNGDKIDMVREIERLARALN